MPALVSNFTARCSNYMKKHNKTEADESTNIEVVQELEEIKQRLKKQELQTSILKKMIEKSKQPNETK